MNIVVIGLGSMGKRRIRLMRQDNPEMTVMGVDSNPLRRQEAGELFKIATFSNISEVGMADCAFVCTAPMSHAEIIRDCLMRGWHVFSELNLHADGYAANIALAQQNRLRLFLSSTFLYRKEIGFIANQVAAATCKLNYSYHVGQYLPDWHPWENYRDYFIGKKETNGCREIFAIELPWITHVFGEIASIHVEKGRMSTLEIDYPDNYLCLITHVDGHKGMVAVDVVSRKAVRNLEVFGEQLHLVWKGNPQELQTYDFAAKTMESVRLYDAVQQHPDYSATIIENAYMEEIRAFFASIVSPDKEIYDFAQDLATLAWIDRIEGKEELC
jgi:predicted dehydrogenase